jgi:hypothetical protein
VLSLRKLDLSLNFRPDISITKSLLSEDYQRPCTELDEYTPRRVYDGLLYATSILNGTVPPLTEKELRV